MGDWLRPSRTANVMRAQSASRLSAFPRRSTNQPPSLHLERAYNWGSDRQCAGTNQKRMQCDPESPHEGPGRRRCSRRPTAGRGLLPPPLLRVQCHELLRRSAQLHHVHHLLHRKPGQRHRRHERRGRQRGRQRDWPQLQPRQGRAAAPARAPATAGRTAGRAPGTAPGRLGGWGVDGAPGVHGKGGQWWRAGAGSHCPLLLRSAAQSPTQSCVYPQHPAPTSQQMQQKPIKVRERVVGAHQQAGAARVLRL